MLNRTLVQEADKRMKRFAKEFQVAETVIDSMNAIIDKCSGRMNLRKGQPERDLDLLVVACFVKAGKTFQAVNILCALGYGEDALVALRANINLMINLRYILAEDSSTRAGDLVAFSHCAQRDYLKRSHAVELPGHAELDWNSIEERAARWKSVGIRDRATKGMQLDDYQVGYTFYSSIEHSDAWALSRYIDEWDEVGPKFNSTPSDKDIEIALPHNCLVMANVFYAYCKHFGLSEPSVFEPLNDVLARLSRESDSSASGSIL